MHFVQKIVIVAIILVILLLGYFYPRALGTHVFEILCLLRDELLKRLFLAVLFMRWKNPCSNGRFSRIKGL